MGRKTNEELKKLCDKLGIEKFWSWSKYHCYKQDHYEYYLKYVLHANEDRTNGIYAVSGGYCHDIIERLYRGEIEYSQMIDEYEDSLFNMNLAELKYDRNDSEKNEQIANKYENCIRHFFKHHNVITAPHRIEHFIIIKISDKIYLQGYIDFLFTEKQTDENDKEITKVRIVDWKTSTRYSGEKIDKECGQLLIYAEGVRQALNIPLENIVCEWNFLKYVTVSYQQKNGSWKDRYIERNQIGEKLVNTAKMWLKEYGYEDDTDKYIDEMILSNTLDTLPDEVREKFIIKDCYVEIPIDESKIEALKQDIISVVNEVNEKETEYAQTKDEQLFWQDVTDTDSYRLANLSNYSRKLHKPYDVYLKEQDMFKNENEDEDNNSNNKATDDADLLDFLNNL